MDTPVIIAARNEEMHISSTLNALSRQQLKVKPIVVVNGCSDRTADIAKNTGATVLESSEGKMLALQAGISFLGKKALENVLILDADSQPMSKKWSQRLTAGLEDSDKNLPSIVWGPCVFSKDINHMVGAFFSFTSMIVSWADQNKEKPRTIRGGNTGIKIGNEALLDDFLSLENYWPRVDVAIYDTFIAHDAIKKVLLHPEAWTQTSGARLSKNLRTILRERRSANEIYDDSYYQDSPANSNPYK